ncbi:hypothetical protein [Legionella quinlivanii]|uniref:hypothetical protein n=1 Tax=Legionella quinlivanii TaxID=45073 RepID=UPI002242E8F7|nr:hypothetical protein [Legionella quinlivanii]MCW8451649.1 hypothetical protein [Legionella quinlivanii]
MPWKKLGEGAFNTAYVNDEETLVFKKPQNGGDATDTPERAVRIWNEINSHIKPAAEIHKLESLGRGWTCPYIKGRQATDREISTAVVDIFNRTGRIIIDAAPFNFITTAQGQTVCIDVGMALLLEKEEEDKISSKGKRRNSIISSETWEQQKVRFNRWLTGLRIKIPESMDTVKALLFIKEKRPDIFDASFLKANPTVAKILADGYNSEGGFRLIWGINSELSLAEEFVNHAFSSQSRSQKPLPSISFWTKDKLAEAVVKGEKILLNERELSLDNLKESCIRELTRYINSRGSLVQGKFSESLTTRYFRDSALTATKVEYAKLLIDKIGDATSIDEIKALIDKQKDNAILKKSDHTSHLIVYLSHCSAMCDVVKREAPKLQQEKGQNGP